jgi:hypothetical protein
MNVVIWVVQVLVGLALAFSGIMKLTQPRAKLQQNMAPTSKTSQITRPRASGRSNYWARSASSARLDRHRAHPHADRRCRAHDRHAAGRAHPRAAKRVFVPRHQRRAVPAGRDRRLGPFRPVLVLRIFIRGYRPPSSFFGDAEPNGDRRPLIVGSSFDRLDREVVHRTPVPLTLPRPARRAHAGTSRVCVCAGDERGQCARTARPVRPGGPRGRRRAQPDPDDEAATSTVSPTSPTSGSTGMKCASGR